MSWLFAFVLCAGGVALETALAGGDVSAQLKSIRQPAWALPLPGWIAIGLAYYVACFVTAQILFAGGPLEGWRLASLMLLVCVMVGNAAFNWTFFKRRWFGVSFWYFLPYGLLVATLIWALMQVEPMGAAIFAIYALYLPYALVWSYRTWQMND